MQWWKLTYPAYPDDLFHVPNERSNRIQRMRLAAEGVLPGVSDYILAQGRGGYFGMYLELKAPKGKVTPAQRAFAYRRTDTGYYAVFATGWEAASERIKWYMSEPPTIVAVRQDRNQ